MNKTVDDSHFHGIHSTGKTWTDYKQFVDGRASVVEGLNQAYEKHWEADGVDLLRGRARFTGPKTVHVNTESGQKEIVTAKYFLIAVGGRPKRFPIPGAEHGITSDDFFELVTLPRNIAVVGAGYVAVELAGIMAALGVEVHMFLRHTTILNKFDPMLQKSLTEVYEAMGIHLHKEYGSFKEVQPARGGQVKLIKPNGTEYMFDKLLWAVGRKPEVDDLGLDAADVKRSDSGHISVDEYQNSSADGIHAVGDVTDQAILTPGT